MIIYHGNGNRNDLRKCRAAAPNYEHGIEWSSPQHLSMSRDERWIMDNGAYVSEKNEEEWRRDDWNTMLDKARRADRKPDFIVLPDVMGDANGTWRRHLQTIETVRSTGFDYYAVAQPGKGVEEQVRFASELGASGVFIGGPHHWKRKFADQFSMTAHDYGMLLHIGRPRNLAWAENIAGADSVDTTSIVRNAAYHRLEKLDGQTTLSSITTEHGVDG